MKRISRLLLAFAMLFVMVLTTACGSKGENATKTFVLERNGIKITLVYTYIESEDRVIKQTSNTIAPYSGFNGLSKEEVKSRIEAAAKQYQGIKGLKESVPGYGLPVPRAVTLQSYAFGKTTPPLSFRRCKE